MALTLAEVKERAEADLAYFIRLIAPMRVLGSVHEDLIDWWTRSEAKSHQLVLLPRAHQKSQLLAYRVAWEITKNPATTILYLSSSSGLAEKQLKSIKQILLSSTYRRFWPEMVNKEVSKRERWTNSEIAVDHPRRLAEGVRDSTVFTGGLTTSLTGFHCDIACLDDIVVQENAYTKEGRDRVKTQYSLLSSIENPEAKEWAVGTRYHPNDLYQDLVEMTEDVFDEQGELVDSRKVYEMFEKPVEIQGEFVWPRQQRHDGNWFGFNWGVLNKKKAQYLDKTQFYAQYYNTPNMGEGAGINPDNFQYYDPAFLYEQNGVWYYKNNRLNVVAALDFAFSLSKKADYTALVVVGVDGWNNTFVLDIYRFRTERIADYFDAVQRAHNKWQFRKMRAEVTVAQKTVVKELRDQYMKPNGLLIAIDEHNPTKHDGDKQERILSILGPRYDMQLMWHYRGGFCQVLEEELALAFPAHDDVKDALASACEIAVAPSRKQKESGTAKRGNVLYHSRFGGVAY